MEVIRSWNVRGLNWPNKQEELKIFLQQNKIGLIGLLETKVKLERVPHIAANIFPRWSWTHNFSPTTHGRIWVVWNPLIYQVHELQKASQYIHCHVTHQFTGKAFYITYVYGANQEGTRRDLWTALEAIALSMDDAWCVMGDFNAVLYPEDRQGGTMVQDFEVRPFQECITNCELQEARYRGPYFSWTNHTVWTRIDRVFTNTLWYGVFDFCQTAYLPHSLSDHTPLVLETPTCPLPQRSFLFCDMWVRDPDFSNLIQECMTTPTTPWPTLTCFLSRVRRRLLTMHHMKYGDLRLQQCHAKAALEAAQLRLHDSPSCLALKAHVQQLREHYTLITNSALDLMRQQSKADWIGQGDDCTRYFFAHMRQRKAATYIHDLRDENGQVYSGFQAVSQHLQNYYHTLLGPNAQSRSSIDPNIVTLGNTLPVTLQHSLCAPFTDAEIRDAIFSIPNLKSPGPDGFTSGFFKATWPSTGPLVCSAVQHFFRTSHLPPEIGRTKLCLIPKVSSPTQAKDFRPISCCSVIYKCITKLLCARLKTVLPHLIHPSQGAFLEGRELLFNVLICQDIVRGYNRKGVSPRCIMKVDLHKAFDSVH